MSNLATPQHDVTTGSHPTPLPARRPPRARIGLLVLGIVTLLLGGSALVGAGTVSVVAQHARDGDYFTTDATSLRTSGHALAVEGIDLDGLGGDWLGTARVRATGSAPDADLFVGVARAADARAYLAGVRYSTVDEIDDPATRYVDHAGGSPAKAPGATDIWAARASGSGTQTLRWAPHGGDWTVVLMNADGSSGVQATADLGATLPVVERATWALLIGGVAGILVGTGLVVLSVRRTPRVT